MPGLHNNKVVSDIMQQMFHMCGISLVSPGWLTLNITGGPCDVYTSKYVNSAFLSQATMLEASLYEQWQYSAPVQSRVYLWSLGVVDINRVTPARDSKYGSMVKELAEVLGIQGGR